jgi:cytochrome c oxidase assembly protein subunit 15
MQLKIFTRIVRITLVLVYFVIIAGSVVRMSGAGMGCPDWPKCFGYYIPPTSLDQVRWDSKKSYKEGNLIIREGLLLRAKYDIKSGHKFFVGDWMLFEKHNYTNFNIYHTWIEYINRLFGVVAGFSCLILFICSFFVKTKRKNIIIWSAIILLSLLFNAWMGSLVVYSVLNPFKVTVHLIGALITIACIIVLLKVSDQYIKVSNYQQRLILTISLAITIIQIVIGSQVRQKVDEITAVTQHSIGAFETIWFYLHRSIVWGVLIINIYLWFSLKKYQWAKRSILTLMLLIVLEISTGLALYYFNFPFGGKALHLIVATIIFGLQFYLSLCFTSRNRL